ncbi:hypothetical protein ACTFIR_001506 [Dictyostelium discoideum]
MSGKEDFESPSNSSTPLKKIHISKEYDCFECGNNCKSCIADIQRLKNEILEKEKCIQELNYYKDPDIIALAKNNHNIDLTHIYDLIFYKNKNIAHCVSEGFEEIQNVYEIAMQNYFGLIDGDHQVLLKI